MEIQTLRRREISFWSALHFSMFFGAGNLIFPASAGRTGRGGHLVRHGRAGGQRGVSPGFKG